MKRQINRSLFTILSLFVANTSFAWQTGEPQLLPAVVREISAVAHDSEDDEPDVRASSFKDVTPGETSMEDVRNQLGAPLDEIGRGSKKVLVYEMGEAFSNVEVIVERELVTSVILNLKTPASVSQVAKDLSIKKFTPAAVPDDAGIPIGLVYPERGILLNYAPVAKPQRVTQIILEPISADSFVHRAMYDSEHRYSQSQKDLDIAIQLDTDNSMAYWLRARLNQAIGAYSAALEDVERAVKLDSDDFSFRMTRAHLLYLNGQHDRALKEIRLVISRNEEREVEARAECLLGDFIAGGPTRDPKLALEHHQHAVQLATPLVEEEDPSTRRTAKRILIDAYLGAANDIAIGNFGNKKQVVPKWLQMAKDLTIATIDDDQGDPELGVILRRRTLTAMNAMGGSDDAEAVIEELFDTGRELIADARDPLYQQHLEWELGESLTHAANYEHEQGNSELVLTYGNNAVALLEPLAKTRAKSAQRDQTLGKLYYFVGAAHAIDKKDHKEAIEYYKRAETYLSQTVPSEEADDVAMHGERFVSMGVSYWEDGNLEKAISLTKNGVRFIDQAVKDKLVDKQALTIPYTNLAAMYRAQGKSEESKALMAMVKKLGGAVPKKR